MNEFKFDYDEVNDDLLIYLDGKKSSGAVEVGNFVVDFDEDENIVGMEILDAKKTFTDMMSRVIEFKDINKIQLKATNFRNMASVRINVIADGFSESANLVLPRVIEQSPALGY